ncbi:hypothetical protein HOLleu_31607 [Holothuria leucospilota]|uniref:Uncharacterized protein n=1 Tax=Holothuria leucospilota TaxID=206669 RepID=A0A9Q0YTK0_HOLLE|nr:hypothetical protein HOLleu_31607 [Holothuria leucospilota]
MVDTAMKNISKELKKIKAEFGQAVEDLRKSVEELKGENKHLKESYLAIEKRAEKLEEEKRLHGAMINKRNNIRIVNLKSNEGESCLDLATVVLEEVGIPACKIERAHRDGRFVEGRERHLLVKVTFHQDMVQILKNARRALADKDYYIVEDLTKHDLKEKRKWRLQVQELYQNGTKLLFYNGAWRGLAGKPYDFQQQHAI